MSRLKLRPFLLAGLVLMGTTRSLCSPLSVGDSFPVLVEIGLAGNLPATERRVLIVDFWASWCAPCKASFRALSRLQDDYFSHGVVVLGVSVDQKAAEFASFLKKTAPCFPVVRDLDQKLVSLVQVPAMPTTYVIGRDGRIRAIVVGYHGKVTDQALRTAIKLILAEHSSP